MKRETLAINQVKFENLRKNKNVGHPSLCMKIFFVIFCSELLWLESKITESTWINRGQPRLVHSIFHSPRHGYNFRLKVVAKNG